MPPQNTAPSAQQKHTATPWQLAHSPKFGDPFITSSTGKLSITGTIGGANLAEQEANAALIIRAVNSHAALVAALRATEAKLTAAARAFYEGGKPSELRAAFAGWRDVAEPARAVLANAEAAQ